MSTFIQTIDIMTKLKSRLEGYELAPGTKLFDRVDYFSLPNLLKAFEELRIFKARVCLVVPSGDDYENKLLGRTLESTASREFILLIADRDYGVRQRAHTGDAADPVKDPGVIRMKDLVEQKLIGDDLDFGPRKVAMRPVTGQPFLLQGKERDEAAGREGWQMTWLAGAGDVIKQNIGT